MVGWFALKTECDVYGKRGAFGSYDPQISPICCCIRGLSQRIQKNGIKEIGLVDVLGGHRCSVKG